ncbi:MAG: ParB N-terminal domain-containing protein [Candidatus Amulumruptor caecigallinarius]|nr:ParB N-terminal domain-containing protein [Candidatus Amulumruptor caecigallinarius]MCM1454357.1 ParB N-terminal domain-containing protein [bacterium]
MNPRKTFEEEALQELADNIEKQGLLQPITVRPIKDGKQFEVVDGNANFQQSYEIVCGERRYRAMSKLNDKWNNLDRTDGNGEPINHFDCISAIVREMTDDEAFDAMITENLQRKDVDPIEEAFAFGKLMETGKSAEEIALRFGKSIRFVQDRCKLNNLIPELMKAVREDKCPISAAMVISKLDADAQTVFYKSYGNSYYGFTKSNAEAFVNNLFMTLDRSLWYQSDDQADKDFEGGCGRKCSECPLNTANHGCLFYEMKPEGAGKCTHRSNFNAKTVAFQLKELAAMGNRLVKKGEPLAYGKVVVAITPISYGSEAVKAMKEAIITGVGSMGLELVDTDEAFQSRCWYGADDERTIEMLQNGDLYRVIRLHDHMTPTFAEEFWHLKGSGTEGDNKSGLPIEVQSLLGKYKAEKDKLSSSLTVTAAETLAKSDTISTGPLTDDEKVLMLSAMIVNNYHLADVVGVSERFNVNIIRGHVAAHPEKWDQIMHGWILCQVSERHHVLRMAEPILSDLGKLHCPDEYTASLDKVREKFNKFEDKTKKKLAALGYDLDGKPLIIKKNVAVTDALKQRKEMKKNHPDVLLIFREGGYYTLYEEDAEVAAPILNLTLTTAIGKPTVKTCGFVHHALDTYLPKLVRAGKRVAVCEQLERAGK